MSSEVTNQSRRRRLCVTRTQPNRSDTHTRTLFSTTLIYTHSPFGLSQYLVSVRLLISDRVRRINFHVSTTCTHRYNRRAPTHITHTQAELAPVWMTAVSSVSNSFLPCILSHRWFSQLVRTLLHYLSMCSDGWTAPYPLVFSIPSCIFLSSFSPTTFLSSFFCFIVSPSVRSITSDFRRRKLCSTERAGILLGMISLCSSAFPTSLYLCL